MNFDTSRQQNSTCNHNSKLSVLESGDSNHYRPLRVPDFDATVAFAIVNTRCGRKSITSCGDYLFPLKTYYYTRINTLIKTIAFCVMHTRTVSFDNGKQRNFPRRPVNVQGRNNETHKSIKYKIYKVRFAFDKSLDQCTFTIF